MSALHLECRDLLRSLSEYVDGELDESLCAALEQHMAECDHCRIVVDTLRKTVMLYHEISRESTPLPQEIQERLFRALATLSPEHD